MGKEDELNEEYSVETPSSSEPSELALREKAHYAKSANPKPNSIYIPLWNGGRISFDPEGSVSIFAAIALLLLLMFSVLIAIAGIFVSGDSAWLNTIFTALGHAITGVVGAIVGSSVAKSNKSDK